ncbi:transcriptional regulator with XRE-family HTH domain [Paenibacillus endophyticus]|uniref:Transcriptional regulator with XRE-family HTH domain n=1 Tax=Paenibacillus endophyticus TaxID=1294268 RepID=A0A7W5C698_9BACL|nr:helix-turn-helix transcriptional regulator [Paenibacillus endophyticus]MBB3151717.1 transcriptional regulator with XRE-family HTH domain [Paenibacillus endophyticus]
MELVNFGEYLRGLRKNKGLTLKALADESKVSQSYITNVENGKRGVPSPDILKRLYIHLDVDYLDLMKAAGHISNDGDLAILMLTPERIYRLIDEIEAAITIENGKFIEKCVEEIKIIMFNSRWYFYNAARKLCLSAGDEEESKKRLKRLFALPQHPNKDFDKDIFFKEVVKVTPEFLFDALQEQDLYDLDEPDDSYSEFLDILVKLAGVALGCEAGHNNELFINFLRDQRVTIDLEEFLDNKFVRYHGKNITDNDRQRILDMLKVLFPDRQ